MGRVVLDFDHHRRLKLHAAGLTDTELAAEVGITQGAASIWRKKAGLKRNMPQIAYETTETERSIMNSFMTDLLILADRAKTKLDQDAISRFMLAWVEL